VGAVSFFRAFASILALMLAALLAANQPAAGEELRSNNIDPTAIEKVDRLFEKWDKPNTPGAVLAIVKDGKIIYSRGYGMANLEEAVPNNSKTVFHLGSVSKQFTAFAIHLLVSDGKLSLDDDVRQYIQESPDFVKQITIRQLLHHTSGLRDQWNLLALAGWRLSDVITDGDVRRILMQQKELNFTPGDEMLYSNSGYSVLAEVVRRVSGMPLSQFAKERIFAPLEMNDTRFQANYGNIIKDRAYSYVPSGDGAYRYDALSYSTYGPSSLFSTVGDLARWDENFYTAKVGGPSVVRALQEKGKLNDGKELDYASGLVIGEYRGAKTVSHSGADAGYKANIVRFPDYHFTVIVLANAGDLDVDGIPLKIADICLAGTLAPAEAAPDGYPPIVKTEVKLEPQALDALLGDFELEPGFIISFTRENGVLFQQATGQAKFALYPSSPNTFFLKVADAEYVFGEVAADGKIHDATLHQNGHSYPLKRLDPFSLTQDELRTHSGAFYSEELGVIYFIREKNGMLSVRYPRGDILLKQTGVNSFLGAFPIGTLKFLCDPNEDCKGFEVDDGRVRNLKFTKINVPVPGTER
jgi:CubicO group peptidase (beta-lactamase class C family)